MAAQGGGVLAYPIVAKKIVEKLNFLSGNSVLSIKY